MVANSSAGQWSTVQSMLQASWLLQRGLILVASDDDILCGHHMLWDPDKQGIAPWGPLIKIMDTLHVLMLNGGEGHASADRKRLTLGLWDSVCLRESCLRLARSDQHLLQIEVEVEECPMHWPRSGVLHLLSGFRLLCQGQFPQGHHMWPAKNRWGTLTAACSWSFASCACLWAYVAAPPVSMHMHTQRVPKIKLCSLDCPRYRLHCGKLIATKYTKQHLGLHLCNSMLAGTSPAMSSSWWIIGCDWRAKSPKMRSQCKSCIQTAACWKSKNASWMV